MSSDAAPSARLAFRRMTQADFSAVAKTLQNAEVARIWTHEFSDADVGEWITRRTAGYAAHGYDYFLAFDRESGAVVGQIGLLDEEILGEQRLCIGYILAEDSRGRGYAAEGARAMLSHAFSVLGAESVACDIRPENGPSLAVARRIGMRRCGEFVKVYRGTDMPHIVFDITRREFERSVETVTLERGT